MSMTDEENIDLSRFEAKTTPEPATGKQPRTKRQSHIGFPFKCIPDFWIRQLREAQNIATFKLALHLLELDWKHDRKLFAGTPIVLTNNWLGKNNTSRWSKRRALIELRNLGLIRVEFRKRQSPIVTLIAPPFYNLN
jgi:hypothetical protein